MIITRTPFRVSFSCVWTDFSSSYMKHGGAVYSVSINKYCCITTRALPPFFDCKYRIWYTNKEETKTIGEIRHSIVREVLRKFDLSQGVEMVHTSDIPVMLGMGSRSAFTVGFLQSMNALVGRMATKRQLAKGAIEIEQCVLKENVGSQDQVATAFGGFNRIDFKPDGEFYVNPATIQAARIKELKDNLLLVFTGFSRYSSEFVAEPVKSIPQKTSVILKMMSLADQAVSILDGPGAIDDFGRLLNENWLLKKSLSNFITNSFIDKCYGEALRAGALGGKILGAGGGGFLLFFASIERYKTIREWLRKLLFVPFEFESLASQIIMCSTMDSDYEFTGRAANAG